MDNAGDPPTHVFTVAQIYNLLYRRIAFCGRVGNDQRTRICRGFADYKSAIQQIANLRYEAELCATT